MYKRQPLSTLCGVAGGAVRGSTAESVMLRSSGTLDGAALEILSGDGSAGGTSSSASWGFARLPLPGRVAMNSWSDTLALRPLFPRGDRRPSEQPASLEYPSPNKPDASRCASCARHAAIAGLGHGAACARPPDDRGRCGTSGVLKSPRRVSKLVGECIRLATVYDARAQVEGPGP